jgi:beta-phosphoglucomutase
MLRLSPGLGLIFDLDGVIVDSMPIHTLAWQRYLADLGVPDTNVAARMHGRRNDEIFRDFLGNSVDDLTIYNHGASKERLFRELMAPELESRLVPGVQQLLTGGKDHPIALATNAEPENVNFVLDGAHLRPYFRAAVDGSQVERAKPAPDVYLRAAELLGIAPKNCIVFEDSPVGITAARAAGARVVGVLTHSPSLEDVDYAVRDFRDQGLEPWLGAQQVR